MRLGTSTSACGLEGALSTTSPGGYVCIYNDYNDGGFASYTCSDQIASTNGSYVLSQELHAVSDILPSDYESRQGVGYPAADSDLTAPGNVAIVSNMENAVSSASVQPIPFGHINSCTDGNTPIVYTYFQVNAMTMRKVVFSFEDETWTPTEPNAGRVTREGCGMDGRMEAVSWERPDGMRSGPCLT